MGFSPNAGALEDRFEEVEASDDSRFEVVDFDNAELDNLRAGDDFVVVSEDSEAPATTQRSIPNAPPKFTQYLGLVGQASRHLLSKNDKKKSVAVIKQRLNAGEDFDSIAKDIDAAGWTEDEKAKIFSQVVKIPKVEKQQTLTTEEAFKSFDKRDLLKLTPKQVEAMSPAEQEYFSEKIEEIGEEEGTAAVVAGLTFGLSDKARERFGIEVPDFVDPHVRGTAEMLGSLPFFAYANSALMPKLLNFVRGGRVARGLTSVLGNAGIVSADQTIRKLIKDGNIPELQEYTGYLTDVAFLESTFKAAGKLNPFKRDLSRYAKANGISEEEALRRAMKESSVPENVERTIQESPTPIEVDNVSQETKKSAGVESSSSKLDVSQKASERSPLDKVPEPIVETTGKGASQQIEYAKTSVDKTIDAMNATIEAAKTPAQSLTRLGEATNKAIFNFLAPLEKLETPLGVPEKVSTRIKLAQSAASEINSVLENGVFSNITGQFEHNGLKGAYGEGTWKAFTKGIKPEEFSLKELDVYRNSKQSLSRQLEGKKTGIDTDIAKQDVARLKDKYEPVATRIRDFNRAVLEEYGKDLLGADKVKKWGRNFETSLYRVMDSGSDSILKAGSLKPKQPFKKFVGSERKQIPASESDPYNTSMLISNARKNDAVLQYLELVQQEKLPGRIRKAKNMPLPESVIKDLDIPKDQLDVAENLFNQTRKNSFTPEKNILKGWKQGYPVEIEVPDDIYEIFSTFAPQERSILPRMMATVNRWFSRGISLEPRKFLSITGRDALSSLIYSRTGSNPLSIFEALGDVFGNKQIYQQFKSMGGDVYASRLAERIDRARKIEELITPGKKGIIVPFEKMGDYFRKYINKLGDISMAVPLAEYKRGIAKYGNTAEGRLMAAMEARKVTYDPTRKGGSKIVREIGNYVPFWNVSLQDIPMVGRNLKNPTTWMKGIGAITLPTLLLKMTNEDNPDYQDLTPVDKAAFWHVYFGDNHVRIPIPWLLGTTFKVGAEFFYDLTKSEAESGNQRAKESWEGLYSNFTENVSGSLPPLLQNYIELSTGKSPKSPLQTLLGTESRAPEVLPKRLQDLPAQLQYTSKTSQLARWFGKHWGISPAKLEKTIKTFGGIVAADALALVDEIAYFTGLAEDKRPEQNEKNYLLLGHFVGNSTPTRTKYATEFYELLREATLDRNASKLIQQKGIEDSGLESVESHGVNLFRYNKSISKLLKQIRSTEDSNLSAKEKKDDIAELQKEINELYKEAVETVRENTREDQK